MKVIRAARMGFCVGVRRAYEKVLRVACDIQTKKIVLLGELVHNREVMNSLKNTQLDVEQNPDEIFNCRVITRTHGITKEIINKLIENGNDVVDLTCTIVQAERNAALKLLENNHDDIIILIGKPDHAEVISSKSWIPNCYVVDSIEDIEKLPSVHRVGVVAQTTYSLEKFEFLCEKIKERIPEVHIINTICPHTAQNQKTSEEIAKGADLVIVVGDPTSSNTKSLFETCKNVNTNTYFLSNASELEQIKDIKKYSTVALTAGASTPDWVIREIEEILLAI